MYYKNGEERFGKLDSRVYAFFAATLFKGTYLTIARDIAQQKARCILDVGGGTGDLIRVLARTIGSARFYYVDPSEAMVRMARKKFDNPDIKDRIKASLGDSTHVPFNVKFDLIISSFSFHHWAKKEESLRYLLKKLNAKGKIILYERNKDEAHGIYSLGKDHFLSEKETGSLNLKGAKKRIRRLGSLLIVEIWK